MKETINTETNIESVELINWIPNNYGKYAMLGKWSVAQVFWDGAAPKGSELNYKAECFLPGIKNYLGNFATEKEAIDIVVLAVEHWAKGSGLSPD